MRVHKKQSLTGWVYVVRSNDIAREHSKVSLPVRRNLNSVAIGQQRSKRSEFMEEQPCRGHGHNVRVVEGRYVERMCHEMMYWSWVLWMKGNLLAGSKGYGGKDGW